MSYARDSLRDPHGQENPLNPTAEQRQSRSIHERNLDEHDMDSFSTDWTLAAILTWVLLPFISLAVVMFMWVGAFAGYVHEYRTFLLSVLPNQWFHPDPEPSPWASAGVVGGVFLLLLIGLYMLGRRTVNRWARGTSGKWMLWLIMLIISLVAACVMILTPGAVILAWMIAQEGAIGDVPDSRGRPRTWPLVLTAGVVLWFAFSFTRRAVRRGRRRRYRRMRLEWSPDSY